MAFALPDEGSPQRSRAWVASVVAVSLAACGSPPDFEAIGAAAARGVAEAIECTGDFTGEGTLTSGGAACPATTSFEISTSADGGVSPPGCRLEYSASLAPPCLWRCVDASGGTRTANFSVSEDASFDGVLTVVTSGDGGEVLACVYDWSGHVAAAP
jgi:hypothetical protein